MKATLPAFINKLSKHYSQEVALFDADGTLWENDIADDCTIWMIGTGRIQTGNHWARYKEIYSKDANEGCRFLLSFYKGMTLVDLHKHVESYWRDFMKMKYIDEPVAVLHELASRGLRNWVVTGSPTDFLFPLLKIMPVERIVGMDFEVDAQGVLTGKHAGISCAGEGKAEKVRSLWQGPIPFAAGNARLDEAMMRLADMAWAVHPHPDLEKVACELNWEIKKSEKPPYGVAGWVSIQEELRERGLPIPDYLKN